MMESNVLLYKILDFGHIGLLNHMGDDNTVVSAARVSHLGKSKGIEKDTALINYLMENHHTSPFEQVEFQFLVKCPIFVARQWMRHRTWSYNEVSRRYTSEDISFYVPSEIRKQDTRDTQAGSDIVDSRTSEEAMHAIRKHSLASIYLYNQLIANGICREQARMVLPLNLYTSFYAKVDLHNLFHFLSLRTSPHAQMEIRVYAEMIEKLIEPIVPISYKAWKELK